MEYIQVLIGLAVILLIVGAYIAACGACLNKSCEIKKEEKVSVIWWYIYGHL